MADPRRTPRPVAAQDITVQHGCLCFSRHSNTLTVELTAGDELLLDIDGNVLQRRRFDVNSGPPRLIEVPFSAEQHDELTRHPLLSGAVAAMGDQPITGRLYLSGGLLDYLEVESADGTQIIWSSRPGWCERVA